MKKRWIFLFLLFIFTVSAFFALDLLHILETARAQVFPVAGATRVGIIQQGNILNSQTTSAVATAQTTTLTGVSGTQVHIQAVSATCSAGTAQLTIQDAGTTIYQTGAAEITTARFDYKPPTALSAKLVGNTMTVGMSTCGAGNTSSLHVEADQY